MKKNFKSTIIKTGLGLILAIVVFGTWYNYTYRMSEAKSFDVNSQKLPTKMLIATQGSDFKDEVLTELIDHFGDQKIFIKVIDVYMLKHIDIKDWDAICIMHTWEAWKPPAPVEKFIDRLPNQDRLAVFTTSGNSTYKMENVDAITGASVMENTFAVALQLIAKIETILQKQENNTLDFSFQNE